MKRLISSIAILTFTIASFSQSEYDAIKLSDTDLSGSARYMGLAGAFGALGGDASAVAINPAGLGIFRSSELSFGTNFQITNASSNWNNQNSRMDEYDFVFNNLNFVINFGKSETKKKGLITSSLSFGYNRLKNFDRSYYLKGSAQEGSMTDYIAGLSTSSNQHYQNYEIDNSYSAFDNIDVPWLGVLAYQTFLIDTVPGTTNQFQSLLDVGETVTPSFFFTESGYINEWSFAYGANISNAFYFGAKIGIRDLQYNSHSEYNENFELGGNMSLSNSIETTGTGVNFSVGIIARPVKFFRLGAAIHTPTFYSINTLYSSVMNASLSQSYTQASPIGSQSYLLRSPFEVDLSAAFIIGKVALLSVDYEFKDYSTAYLKESNAFSGGNAYQFENDQMDTYFNKSQMIRAGLELKIKKDFALRFGFAGKSPIVDDDSHLLLASYTTTATTEYANDKVIAPTNRFSSNFYTGGFGYRHEKWFFDFAYVLKKQGQLVYTFNSTKISAADLITYTNNIVTTIGFRF